MLLNIWIASFIPKDIAGYTEPVPKDVGKTMIPGPTPANDCFFTDQRTFSANPKEPARMRSIVTIETDALSLISANHQCGNTIECDCEDGEIECDKPPDNSGLKIERFITAPLQCTFTFVGAASNPCFAGAPSIHWEINVTIKKQSPKSFVIEAELGSKIGAFPSFEMYVSAGTTTKPVFQVHPAVGATAWAIDEVKTVAGKAAFSL